MRARAIHLTAVVFALLFLSASSAIAQQISRWDAGEVSAYDPAVTAGLHRGSITVINVCCKDDKPQHFTVSSQDEWIRIHEHDSAFDLPNNGLRHVHPGFDIRKLRPGVHEGTISVRCTTCDGGRCDYDVKVKLTVGQQGTQVRDVSIPSSGCPTPAVRIKPGSTRRKCTFTGVTDPEPRLSIVPCAGYGEHASPEMLTLLGDMASAMSAFLSAKSIYGGASALQQGATAGDALSTGASAIGSGFGVDVPTTPAEMPVALASTLLRIGQEIVNLGSRMRQRRSQMCLEISGEVEIRGADYDCVEWQICEQGVWRDEGLGHDPRDLEIPPPVVRRSRREFGPVQIIDGNTTELKAVYGRVRTWVNQIRLQELFTRMEIFEAHGPCHACDPRTGGTADGDGGPGGAAPRDCSRFLREIALVENELFEIRAALDDVRRRLAEVPGRRSQLEQDCTRRREELNGEISEARSALQRARAAARLGNDAPHLLKAEGSAQARLDAAHDAWAAEGRECDRMRQELDREEQKLGESIGELEQTIAQGEAHLEDLRAQYRECLGQGGGR
jgi:hypothetical protein